MRETPQLKHIEQVSDGWIKKYILTYVLPDGSDYIYEAASRKGLEAYHAELARLEARSNTAIAAIDEGAEDFGAAAVAAAEQAAGTSGKRTADAVSIVPITRDGNLVLIREFRYPLNSWCIACPAGLMEPGEDVAACVDRELREETGYRLRTDVDEPVRLLPQAGFSSTGLTDEAIQIVFAQVEKAGDAQPEESELIRPFQLSLGDVRRFLDENTTLIGTRAQLILEVFAARAER